jgi:predicted MPP superfamily phosphohydrolase
MYIGRKRAKAAPDVATAPDQLKKGWLHWVLVGMNVPANWPAWLVGMFALLPVAGVAGLWWLLVRRGEAGYVALALACFVLTDALVLLSLPRWRISFGPLGPQLFILEAPRLAVVTLAAPVALWLGAGPALSAVIVINLAATLALLWGALVEPRRLHLSLVSLEAGPLAGSARPLRVLHVSDVHVERFGRREEQLVQWVRGIAPDILVFSGDYINLSYIEDPTAHADTRRLLEALVGDADAPFPGRAFAVLGSPSVDRNSASLFDGLPIRLLRNEVVVIDLPVAEDGNPVAALRVDSDHGSNGAARRSQQLAVVGLDCTHDPEQDARRLAALATQAPAHAFRLLLYHSPELMPAAVKLGIDLYLCGHTHGGQIRLPFYGALVTASKLGKRFDMGHYQRGEMHLYVSRGVGLEGMGAPRVRFLCPPEITLFLLDGNRR